MTLMRFVLTPWAPSRACVALVSPEMELLVLVIMLMYIIADNLRQIKYRMNRSFHYLCISRFKINFNKNNQCYKLQF